MKKFSRALAVIGQLQLVLGGNDLTCPLLDCYNQNINKAPIIRDLCFKHDAKQPTQKFISHSCDWYETYGQSKNTGEVVCEFDLLSEKFAWVNERYQPLQEDENAAHSILNYKKTEAYCKEVPAIINNLNNGRSCKSSWQCVSQRCINFVCQGLDQGENCNMHVDCGPGQFCKKSTAWPFVSMCNKLRTSYEGCAEDFECPIAHYCWYASIKDVAETDERQCLPQFSQDHEKRFGWKEVKGMSIYENMRQNGRFCKSGMAVNDKANQSMCTRTEFILLNKGFRDGIEVYPTPNWEKMLKPDKENHWKNMLQDSFIDAPYECDPSNNQNFCWLFYNITNFVTQGLNTTQHGFATECKCSLGMKKDQDGKVIPGLKQPGYCNSILGTERYEDGLGLIKPVLESSKCHTLDRYDWRAQKDGCGIKDKDEWRDAVKQNFTLSHYPYMVLPHVKECISKMSKHSLFNLQKNGEK